MNVDDSLGLMLTRFAEANQGMPHVRSASACEVVVSPSWRVRMSHAALYGSSCITVMHERHDVMQISKSYRGGWEYWRRPGSVIPDEAILVMQSGIRVLEEEYAKVLKVGA